MKLMDTSNTPNQLDISQPHFASIWGTKETRCSALIAQTMVLSDKFQEFFADILNINREMFRIDSIQTEYYLSASERIDIHIICFDGLRIGVEIKNWAGLQEDQLIKYANLLKAPNDNYKLVFLAPSRYQLDQIHKPENLVEITYRDIYQWIRSQQFNSIFESHYFEQLLLYLDQLEVEMPPLNNIEIQSLVHAQSVYRKTKAVLDQVNKYSSSIENPRSYGYMLFGIFEYEYPIYVGFRYAPYWEYEDKLLNKMPECLIYVKDISDDSVQEQHNLHIIQLYSRLKQIVLDPSTTLRHYPRKSKNECRLSIRKSLLDFEGKEISEIVVWFEENLNLLKRAIETVTKDITQDSQSSIL